MKIKFIILCGILFLSFNSLGQSEKPNDLNQLKYKQFIKKGEDLLDAGRIGDAYGSETIISGSSNVFANS